MDKSPNRKRRLKRWKIRIEIGLRLWGYGDDLQGISLGRWRWDVTVSSALCCAVLYCIESTYASVYLTDWACKLKLG